MLKMIRMHDRKRTMTLNLSEREMEVLEDLCRRKDMNKTGVIKHALKLYQLLDHKIAQGDKVYFEDASTKKQLEVMII